MFRCPPSLYRMILQKIKKFHDDCLRIFETALWHFLKKSSNKNLLPILPIGKIAFWLWFGSQKCILRRVRMLCTHKSFPKLCYDKRSIEKSQKYARSHAGLFLFNSLKINFFSFLVVSHSKALLVFMWLQLAFRHNILKHPKILRET